jgi:ABC-type sugar transport system ATPase subunit
VTERRRGERGLGVVFQSNALFPRMAVFVMLALSPDAFRLL